LHPSNKMTTMNTTNIAPLEYKQDKNLVAKTLYPDNVLKYRTILQRPVSPASSTSSSSSTSIAASRTLFIRSNIIGNRCLISSPFGSRREIVYADYTASGRALEFIEQYMLKVVAPTYANTHTEASATGAQTTQLREEARDIIRMANNAPRDEYTVLFTGSGSTGAIEKLFRVLGIGIPEFADKKWNLSSTIPESERPVVFVSHFEHHSNELIWRESLARCIVIREGPDGTPDLEHLDNELLKYSVENVPMIGSFSAGSNVTGIRAPVRSICKLLHKHGAYAFFDYAGVGAYVKVDIAGNEGRDGSIDAAFFSPHKFIGGPGSSGVLIARNVLFHQAFDVKTEIATTPGGGTIDYVSRFRHKYSENAEYREDAGTPGILQDIRAGLAFKVKEMVGSDIIERLEHIHCSIALNRWRTNPSIALMGADRVSYHFATRRVSIFSFNILSPLELALRRPASQADLTSQHRQGTSKTLKDAVSSALSRVANVGSVDTFSKYVPLHYNFIIALLNDVYGIQGRGGCSCAGPYGADLFELDESIMTNHITDLFSLIPSLKPGWARLNLNYFISKHEVTFLTEAVNQIAKYGWTLLPLYVQDLKSGRFLHHSMIDCDGFKRKDTDEQSSMSSLHDLRFENVTLSPAQKGFGKKEKLKVTFTEPKQVSGERPRSSYMNILTEAKKIFSKEAARSVSRANVRNFTTDSLSGVEESDLNEVWWLLPKEAEAILVSARNDGKTCSQNRNTVNSSAA